MRKVGLGVSALLLGSAVVGCNDHLLDASPGQLVASPADLDFGRVHEQHDQQQTVVLTNVGGGTIDVTGLSVDPLQATFTFDGAPPSPAAPWHLGPNEWKAVYVHFSPLAAGDQEAILKVLNTTPEV